MIKCKMPSFIFFGARIVTQLIHKIHDTSKDLIHVMNTNE
jgi:hypothetical protein